VRSCEKVLMDNGVDRHTRRRRAEGETPGKRTSPFRDRFAPFCGVVQAQCRGPGRLDRGPVDIRGP
jgi:hypothetical protein